MTTPPGSDCSGALDPPASAGRVALARQWEKALRTTAYVPTSRAVIDRVLRELLDQLFDSLAAEKFSPEPGRMVGQRLVDAYYINEQSVSRTMEVLGQGLPTNPELQGIDGLANKVVAVLGTVAAGYAAALRDQIFVQQEEIKKALLKARRDAERELRVSEAKFRQLFTSSAVGIAISDVEGKFVQINQALREIVGDLAAGYSLYELFHPDDVAPLRIAYRELAEGKRTGSRLPQRIRLIDKDGEPAWSYLAVALLRNVDGELTDQVTIVEDVTELHLLGQELRHQSLHDALTGLPNQQFFMSTLERVLERAGHGSRIIVCKVDLDSLSAVNDGFGRETGDQVLQSVAGRLQSIVASEKAIVARFGSDEFAILIENSATTPDVSALAVRINSELAEPVSTDSGRVWMSGCVGVAEYQGRGGKVARLLRAAEATLHRAKSSGKRQWGLFDSYGDAHHRSRCRLAAAMPGAWGSGEIHLDYQPLVRLVDGAVVGIQALLRWDHPPSGSLSHQECLELATRTGLITPLGQWMLQSACAQYTSWRPHWGEVTPLLHVALTPQQAHDPDLVAGIVGAMEHTAFAAESLQLGIPVSALAATLGEAEDKLRVFADMGVSIVLLGFSGVADVAYLEDLPVRAVEIAPAVVQRVAQRLSTGSAVLHAVPVMCQLVHDCEATVMVRGIDTRNEADWWKSIGADVAQGALLAPPASPGEIVALLGSADPVAW
jgi:diguanylate cyclase (GGDEF)-like protein/PAS domain S-box-containing protein